MGNSIDLVAVVLVVLLVVSDHLVSVCIETERDTVRRYPLGDLRHLELVAVVAVELCAGGKRPLLRVLGDKQPAGGRPWSETVDLDRVYLYPSLELVGRRLYALGLDRNRRELRFRLRPKGVEVFRLLRGEFHFLRFRAGAAANPYALVISGALD